MKKEALISALLLGGPMSYLQAQDITVARAQVQQQRQNLIAMQFIAKNATIGEFWVEPTKSVGDDWGVQKIEYRYRISFIRAENDHTYDGVGGMEYEAIIEAVDEQGNVLPDYLGFHYVKRLDENTFQMFDCDSTRRCSEDSPNIVFHIFETPSGKLLKFKNSSEQGQMAVNMSKEFYQVK